MLPAYVWLAVFVGRYHDKPWSDYLSEIVIITPLVVLGVFALVQLLGLAFRDTISHTIFRLVVIDAQGRRAGRAALLRRWAVVWLPLLVPLSLAALWIERAAPTAAVIGVLIILALWTLAAAYAVLHPNRGLHDRLAATWLVRR